MFGYRAGVARGRVHHNDPARRRRLDVHVRDGRAAHAHEFQRAADVEHVLENEIRFHDEHRKALVADAGGERVRVADAPRIQPALIADAYLRAQPAQLPLLERREYQRAGAQRTSRLTAGNPDAKPPTHKRAAIASFAPALKPIRRDITS